METVCFVILHYGDADVTDACVQSILRMEQRERIRIVIVDNDLHESEEHRQRLSGRYAHVSGLYVLRIEENGGFSYANNKGYAFAREQLNASFVVAANNDIEFVQKDFLRGLDEVYREHPCHVLGPDIVRRSTGEHQNPMDVRLRTKEEAEYTIRMNRLALKLYPLLYPALYFKLKKDEKENTLRRTASGQFDKFQEGMVLFGSCLIFSPLFVSEEAVLFEPETEFYYEEYLLAHRCLKKGYRLLYAPSLRVMHESSASTRKSYQSMRKRIRFILERTEKACSIYRKMIDE